MRASFVTDTGLTKKQQKKKKRKMSFLTTSLNTIYQSEHDNETKWAKYTVSY